MLAYFMVNMWSKKEIPFRKFLPPWYEVPLGDPEEWFRKMLDAAEGNGGEQPSRRSPR